MTAIPRGRRVRKWLLDSQPERVGISLPFLGHIGRETRNASLAAIVRLSDVLSGEIFAEGKAEVIDQPPAQSRIPHDPGELR